MERIQGFLFTYRYHLAFVGMGFIYLCNLFIDVMNVDAAQYASIAREMSESDNYLQVYHRGKDYLDKPPLLFWLSSLSFELFGISNVSFKLPALLVIILGIYSTYRLAKGWYGEEVGRWAALILGYSQAVFLMTNDIRTDGLLMGWIIFAVWQFSDYLRNKKIQQLLLGSIGVGLAMLTKGPIGLIIPAAAFTVEFAIKRQWKNFLRWEWLVALIIILLTLSPMLWGLYHQFDLHPEKEVYGLKGPSGIKFFFWTQSFGRVSGDIYWDNGAPFYYFLETILWDFQPWIFLLFPAIFTGVREWIKSGFKANETREYLSLGAFVLGFLMLSFSNYKLPHYIFPLFPFAAIISSQYLLELKENGIKKLARVQFGFLHLFYIAIGVYFFFCFAPPPLLDTLVLLVGLAAFWTAFRFIENQKEKFIFSTLVASICMNLVLSLHFYPILLDYQVSNEVGRRVAKANKEWDEFFCLYQHTQSLDFYSRRINSYRPPEFLVNAPEGTWVYTNDKGLAELNALDPNAYDILDTYEAFRVTSINFKFLLRSSRPEVLKKRYLLVKN